jgi:hypothetical protein
MSVMAMGPMVFVYDPPPPTVLPQQWCTQQLRHPGSNYTLLP